MMTPFPGNTTSVYQEAFNFYQSQCRIVVECLFGLFIARWGIFWKDLQFNLHHVVEIINACLRLHNFCTNYNLAVLDSHYPVPVEFRQDDRGLLVNPQLRVNEAEIEYEKTGNALRQCLLDEIQKRNLLHLRNYSK